MALRPRNKKMSDAVPPPEGRKKAFNILIITEIVLFVFGVCVAVVLLAKPVSHAISMLYIFWTTPDT
jgi:flagellar basal body-associated protein FliL